MQRALHSLEVTGSCSKQPTGWREIDGNNRVLVPLQNALCLGSFRVPELHTTVLAAGCDPLAVR